MKNQNVKLSLVPLVVVLGVMGNGREAKAGPPLLCHAIETGGVESLPWGTDSWHADRVDWGDKEFVERTLEFLSPTSPILSRMETIRRATIHAAKHASAGKALLREMAQRTQREKPTENELGLWLFDLGYLVATAHQVNELIGHESQRELGFRGQKLPIPEDQSGYDLVKRAGALLGGPPEIEFALAVMTTYPAHPAHGTHLKNAIAGTKAGSLLAKNLQQRFMVNPESFSQVIAK